MAVTRMIQARVPESLEARARASSPELLAGLDISHLVRVALAALAGQQITDAIPAMRRRAGNPGKQREEPSA
jgi:antitoxin component of RelBE/YafQ-DinJ toxin-antitoxin module